MLWLKLSIQASIWNLWLIFCMKTVGVRVSVIMGLCKLINTSVPAKYAETSSQYAVLAHPSVRLLANSCEHNSSNNYLPMILQSSRIVTHGTLLFVKAGFFYSSFSNRVMPLFKYFLWAYNAPVGGALVLYHL